MKTKEQENIDKLIDLLDTRIWKIEENDSLSFEGKKIEKKIQKMINEMSYNLLMEEINGTIINSI